MTRFPKLTLAAALIAGVSGAALTAPAFAKKDDKPAATGAPALKLSPDVIKNAKPAQDALAANNTATAEPAVAAIEAAAKSDDDKYVGAVLRLQLEALKLRAAPAGQKVNESVLKAPLDVLIANPKTPAAQLPQFAYQRGAIAFNEGNNAEAIRYFTQAKQLGYADNNLTMALVKAKIDSGDVAGGTAELDTAIKSIEAKGQKAPEDYYRYALGQSVKKGLKPQSIDWMRKWLAAYPTTKNWHDGMYIYGLQQGSLVTLDKAQIVDLFRLMRQTRSLDQYGYEEYAQKVLDSGLPEEARTVITEGRSTGKLPATSNATAIVQQATKQIQIEGSLAGLEAKARAAGNGALASQTGDAYLGQGNYAKAVALYQVALQKGGVKTDEVNTHLGIALAMSGDKTGAKAAFGAVSGAPRTDIAQFWMLYLDHPATA